MIAMIEITDLWNDPIIKFSLAMFAGYLIYFVAISVGEAIADDPEPKCEMSGCHRTATHYGGYAGANDWAGRVCQRHAEGLAWYEELRR